MAGEIYLVRGAPITWRTSGVNKVLNLAGLTADSVRVGAYHDWGASPQPDAFEWRFDVDGFDAAPTIGEAVNLYLSTSQDASLWTGPEAPSDTADGVGSTNRLPNLALLGAAVVVSVTAGDNAVSAGQFQNSGRYFAPVIHNNTGVALLTAGEAHRLIITPLYYQSQP